MARPSFLHGACEDRSGEQDRGERIRKERAEGFDLNLGGQGGEEVNNRRRGGDDVGEGGYGGKGEVG